MIHLVFAKHSDDNTRVRVRGNAFSARTFDKILSERPSGRFAVILEDHFIGGVPFVMAAKNIRHSQPLREKLAAETRKYRDFVAHHCRLAGQGSDQPRTVLRPSELISRIIDENQHDRGKISVHTSGCSVESQLYTLESLFWKNAAYLDAYRDGNPVSAVANLVKSLGLMVSAVRLRDQSLIHQALDIASTVDEVVVLQGSNHRNLANADWAGSRLSVHTQDDDQFPYYDEMLIAALGPRSPGGAELEQGMKKEIAFHWLFYQSIPTHSGYIEDLILQCRRIVENGG